SCSELQRRKASFKERTAGMQGDDWLHARYYRRQTVLGLAVMPLLGCATRAADDVEASKPPAPDDHFVFLSGPKKGQIVLVEDVALGGPQVQAYPAAPDGTVRDASRLNLVVLARFDRATPLDRTGGRAGDGAASNSA